MVLSETEQRILTKLQEKGVHISKINENHAIVLTQDIVDVGYPLDQIKIWVEIYNAFSFGMGIARKDVDSMRSIFHISY